MNEVPIGSVVAWLKSFTGTPSLSFGWVECNGQVLSDAGSRYNGATIPDLNGSSGTKKFLRGSTASGSTGGADTYVPAGVIGVTGTCTTTLTGVGQNLPSLAHIHAFTGTSASYLPSYYEVVYVLRVK